MALFAAQRGDVRVMGASATAVCIMYRYDVVTFALAAHVAAACAATHTPPPHKPCTRAACGSRGLHNDALMCG